MVVCVCNNLRTKCVRDAISEGARSPAQVHACHGAKVNCGQCVPFIADALMSARTIVPAE